MANCYMIVQSYMKNIDNFIIDNFILTSQSKI